MICPVCGDQVRPVTTRYGLRHACCGLWSWGGAPLVDRDTHDARKAAHAAFDPIWKSGHMSRSQAYAELARRMGLHPKDCHMKLMDAATARRAVEVAMGMR